MADIFSMDGYEADLVAGVSNLNYRLLEEEEDGFDVPVPFTGFQKRTSEDDSNDSDTVAELLARPIPARTLSRRRSSVSKYSSSYEVDIHESFVSSSLNSTGYRPKLSDFEPIKVLGHGSYGKVLLVREKRTGRLFAQKQLKKASLIINETNEVHQKNYERTINEKTILEKVNHPNIVKLYYAFQDNNKVYLILEYLDGGEVFHHLAQQRYLSEKDASFYIAQIVLALRYLHSELKVIYRDLKPENCLLNSAGHLVLTDFGLSKMSSDDADANHSLIGTAQYMAPEVIKGENYDFCVDWWSLGCVAFDMLTGGPPFTGHTNEKIMDKIVHSKKYLKFPFYLSHDAKDLLRKLLQPNPSKRFDIDVDFDEFKRHRFFRHIDWKLIEAGCGDDILPPILPVITDPILAENFDEEFTTMQFTPPTNDMGFQKLPAEILHVEGFTFTNESFLSSILGGQAHRPN
ncbi:hypothetical protein JCM33374_g1382 [Metschnikowia sp. JCM 33374]|nr:hypothetical protein JCM33374_g1382 [Metschnikowia sp. JCM 33374]